MFEKKTVVVGITGGIAAYKSAELVSRLKKKGALVYCIMTRSACEFITPLTLRTLTENPVYTEMFEEPKVWNVEHVGLADKADLLMVVPATANLLGKVCHGIADDFLTTVIMATKAPVMFAPAMNVNMYKNPVNQRNLEELKQLGYTIIEPGVGKLACGYEGQGRLADLDIIMEEAKRLLIAEKPLTGLKILVTAGPTREPIDPVRYITNHSTGKMGYAIARQACLRGAQVTLVSGPTALSPLPGIECINVETAQQMYSAVMTAYENTDIVIKAAAVADYRPKEKSANKIKKDDNDMSIELQRNPDILAGLGSQKGSRILVGFAAETNDVIKYAAEKAKRKNLDFIVANDLTVAGAGFGCDTNIASLIFPNGDIKKLPQMSKDELAGEILNEVVRIVEARSENKW